MKVAFASTDGKMIDEHFGWAKKFYVYEVEESSSLFLEERFVPEGLDLTEESNRIGRRIDVIGGCIIMYCGDIGATAAAKITRALIHPIKVKSAVKIEEELKRLQDVMKNPPIWIKRGIQKGAMKEQKPNELKIEFDGAAG